MTIEDDLVKMATNRYYRHKKRCELIKKPLPRKEDFIFKLLENYNNGFKCSYCGKQLILKQKYPYKDLPSIDHDIPLTMGGESVRGNMTICCVACNIIKGTMTGEAYRMLLKTIGINSELFNRLYDESFNGKMANKLERLEEDGFNKRTHKPRQRTFEVAP